MAKILLVEDDNNLREIYEARLQAEGYTIFSAHDGEEALVVAKAEKPDLIISDVMMPKISGFEMLDILRNTDSLKNVKVIMLTALGQSDDQERANKLGTDRYLVKSQVTLEDIVNVTNELLQAGAKPADVSMPSSSPAAPTYPTASTNAPDPVNPPSESPIADAMASKPTTTPAPNPPVPSPNVTPTATSILITSEPAVAAPPVTPTDDAAPKAPPVDTSLAETTSEEENTIKTQISNFIDDKTDAEPTAEETPKAAEAAPGMGSPMAGSVDDAPSQSAYKISGQSEENNSPSEDQSGYSPQPAGKKVITPLQDQEPKPDINDLLEQEKAKEIISSAGPAPNAPPTMSAADTAPTPDAPVITPSAQEALPLHAQEGVDPNSVAL